MSPLRSAMRVGSRAALVAAGLLAAAAAHAALPPTATDDPWVEVRTPRFHVFSNAGPTVATQAARHLERLADAMAMTVAGLRVDGGHDVRVYVFRNLPTFLPYQAPSSDESGISAGYQASGYDAMYIAYFADARDASRRYAAHEYTHAVLGRNLGVIPTWMNEGLAEYFSTFVAKSQSAQIGRPILTHRAWLRQHMLPLSYLLLISADNPDYQQGANRFTLYAESWALVHMLLMDPADRGARFDALVEELARGTPSTFAVMKTYGPGAVDSLQRQLRLYVAQRDLAYVEYPFDTPFESVPVEVRSLDRAETWTVLGDLLAHADERLRPLAREHLEAAWHADSTRVLPAALLARLATRQQDGTGAERWLTTVERAASAEPRALGLAGCLLEERGVERPGALPWPSSGASDDALRARALLTRALAVEPDRGEWLARLGMTYLDDSTDWDHGIGPLLQAQGDWPRRADIVGALSVLNLRAGNRGAAVAQYRSIPPGPARAWWRERAGRLITSATRGEVVELARNGRFAEAESLVVRLGREVAETGTARFCDQLRGWVLRRAQREEPGKDAAPGGQ